MQPKETATISDGSDGAFSSEKVAKKLVASIARGKFYLDNPDILLQIHAISVKGLVNRHFPRVLLEMLIGFIAPILHLVHTNTMDRISRSFAGERFQRVYDRT